MRVIHTKYSAGISGHYVPAIAHNGFLFISGQLSVNPETGRIPEGGIKEETRQALKNLDMTMKSANVTKNDVLHCRVYIPDVVYWDEVNDVYKEFFGDHKPARVVVPTTRLHNGCLVEIEAVCACEES